jgi:dTDP-glucose 4,6-dehydratase
MTTLLVTGGCGFIGSNLVRHLLNTYPEYQVWNLDALTYAGKLENVQDLEANPRYRFFKGQLQDKEFVHQVVGQGVDYIMNLAAESHVDRSIKNPGIFIETNITGTQVLLEAARTYGVRRFLQCSTDEVYGTLGAEGYFTEETPLAPNSPYAASKAGADFYVRAYHETFGLEVVTTRCSNNYGPYQLPEKLIPYFIALALENKPLPVYGNGQNVRDWLYVNDHCRAMDMVLHKGESGQVYNVGGHNERTNLQVIHKLLNLMGKSEDLIEYVKDRPGHDLRYAIDPAKIGKTLGWEPTVDFETGLAQTVDWYLSHQDWVHQVRKDLTSLV